MRGEPDVREIYDLNIRLLSNYLCYVVIYGLAKVVDMMTAAKIFVAWYVVGLPWMAYAWLRRVNPENVILALAVPILTPSLFLAKGNLNFCAGLVIYLAGLWVVEDHKARSGWLAFRMSLLSILLFFTHGLVSLTLMGAILCLTVIESKRRAIFCAVGILPGAALFAAMFLKQTASGDASRAMEPIFSAPDRTLFTDAFGWMVSPFGWGLDSYPALVVVLILAVLVVLTLLESIRCWSDVSLGECLKLNRIGVVSVFLCMGYVLAPVRLADWGHLRVRFLPLAAFTLLGWIRAPRRGPTSWILISVFAISSFSTGARTVREYTRGSDRVVEYLKGLDAVEPGTSIIPIDIDDVEEKDVRTNLHSWAYYEMARGGWTPYLHAYPTYHPVVYKTKPWAPSEDLRGQVLAEPDLVHISACYDYVLLWTGLSGLEDVWETALTLYYEPLYRSADLVVWRNKQGIRRASPASRACAEAAGTVGPPR